MSYAIEHIVQNLKEARERKGLSQRALSKQSGAPQGQISKIENGAVDLRLSSLIALARALDLELELVPRKTVPAVRSIVRSSVPKALSDVDAAHRAVKELKHLHKTVARVSKAAQGDDQFAQLQRQIRDLQRFNLGNSAFESIRQANKTLEALKGGANSFDAIRQVNSQIQQLRNALAHGAGNIREIEPARPAYSLDEEDEDA